MDYLSRVHIDELRFLVGDAVSSIEIGKYQIVLILNSGAITIYSKLYYTNKNNVTVVNDAEEEKLDCSFTEILEKKIDHTEFQEPAFLVLEFDDHTRLKILGDGSGYEAFLVNTSDGRIFVFS